MAIDTSRDRLERLFFAAGDRRLWGKTWAGFVTREPNRVIVRSARRSGMWSGLVLVGVIAFFGLVPAIAAIQELGRTMGFPWSRVTTCDGLAYRYEIARDTLGAPRSGATRADFASARTSCEAFANTLPVSARSVSCHAAIRTYVRAFRRAERGLAGSPAAAADSGFVAAARTRRETANEILEMTDLQSDERLASSYLDACLG